MIRFPMKQLVGLYCVDNQTGDELYNSIMKNRFLDMDSEIVFDFEGVQIYSSPFFNALFGRFIKDFTVEEFHQRFKIINMKPHGKEILEHVLKNAERYYRGPELRLIKNEE